MRPFIKVLCVALACANAYAAPGDRVYTADQNSNTISVINPDTNTLLGQIRLGNARPDVLSPLYRGQINVHGLGFRLTTRRCWRFPTVPIRWHSSIPGPTM